MVTLSATTTPFATVATFVQAVTVYAEHTLSTPLAIGINTVGALPGATAVYRIKGNGVVIPTITGALKIVGSSNFDKSANAVNTLQIWFDGTGFYYHWVRPEVTPPNNMTPLGLTFSAKNSSFITVSPNTYSSSDGVPTGQPERAFTGWGGSAQAIPTGKNGQVTFLLGGSTVVGLHTANNLQAVAGNAPAWNYTALIGGNTLYAGGNGIMVPTAVTGITPPRLIQLRRVGSSVSLLHKLNESDPWITVMTYSTPTDAALFVMLATTAIHQVKIISFEVAA
jgi:hypothetical protein